MKRYRLRKPMPGELKGDIFKYVPLRKWYTNISFNERQNDDVTCVYPKKLVEESPDWFEEIEEKTYTEEELEEIIIKVLEFRENLRKEKVKELLSKEILKAIKEAKLF